MSSIVSFPLTLWHLYVDNLVFYKPGSWVDSIASFYRILAFVLIAPFILLMLLDVASYVIARTLGVIDETKASTTGESEPGLSRGQPKIVVEDADTARAAATPLPVEDEDEDEDDGNLKLSGVDTFSPAPSQPGSPTLQRRELVQHQHQHALYGPGGRGGRAAGELLSQKPAGDGDGDGDGRSGSGNWSGATTPREPVEGEGSSSGESSFALLDPGSGSEDAGVVLRKRTRKAGTEFDTGLGTE